MPEINLWIIASMGSQWTSCEEKKHLKNVLVGKKKPVCQIECQKRRVNLTYQLWNSLGVCKLWDNVTLSSQTFFPIYCSVCLSSQCPGILLLYGHWYAEISENVTFFFFFFFSKSCSSLFFEWRLLCVTHSRVSLTRITAYVYHKKMLSITVIWFQDLLL